MIIRSIFCSLESGFAVEFRKCSSRFYSSKVFSLHLMVKVSLKQSRKSKILVLFYSGCEEPKILNSTSYGCPGGPEENSNSWCQVFPASNLLTLDTDFRSGNDANYWLTEDGKTGGEQGFIIDLGCEKTVQGVSLRNTHTHTYSCLR